MNFRIFISLVFIIALILGKSSYAAEKKNPNPECVSAPYEKLLSGISSGDAKSLVTFFRCMDYHDGGNREDLYIEAIHFYKRDPYLYGYILEKEGALTTWECLPNSLFDFGLPENVDNFKAKKDDYLVRLRLTEHIENKDLRDKAQSIIKESLERYDDLSDFND